MATMKNGKKFSGAYGGKDDGIIRHKKGAEPLSNLTM